MATPLDGIATTPTATPHALRRVLDRTYLMAGALGAGCIALICILMVVQTLGRQFGFQTGAITDVVSWLCAAAAFMTMAHAFKHGDFVRVTLVLEKLSASNRRRFELVCLAVACVAMGYLAWWACRFTFESWQFNELAQGLWAIPIWIPQMSFAIGSVLFLVALVDELLIVVRGGIPTYVRLVEERHAQGDFSSDL
ncbi:TRAP transporter small permease [Variovorax sp. AFSI2.2]|uniref:TRAP transporter small permease n=1 Tax=Variovorax sp. AFSI2.2 TaxID=3384160 RepID=UPI003EBF3383